MDELSIGSSLAWQDGAAVTCPLVQLVDSEGRHTAGRSAEHREYSGGSASDREDHHVSFLASTNHTLLFSFLSGTISRNTAVLLYGLYAMWGREKVPVLRRRTIRE